MLRHDRSHQPDGSPRAQRGPAAEIASLRRLAIQRAVLSVTAAAAAGLVAAPDPRLGVAFAAGSAGELALAAAAERRRGRVLLRLATDPRSYALGEVRRLGAALTARRRRVALSRTIAAVLREASRPDSVYLPDRVAAQAPALAAIARALADEETFVEPVAIATLLELLTDGVRSPLLSWSATPEQLSGAMARIAGGIHPRNDAPAGHTQRPDDPAT